MKQPHEELYRKAVAETAVARGLWAFILLGVGFAVAVQATAQSYGVVHTILGGLKPGYVITAPNWDAIGSTAFELIVAITLLLLGTLLLCSTPMGFFAALSLRGSLSSEDNRGDKPNGDTRPGAAADPPAG